MSEAADLLKKASLGGGLRPEEVECLLDQGTSEDWREVYAVSRSLTQSYFQKRIRFFAPLYFSSFCINDCAYCGFQVNNRLLKRRVLSEDEFLREARFLWAEGHRTLLLIAGEHPVHSGVGQIASYVAALRRAGLDFSLMVELAPLSVEDYGVLRELGVHHCLLFQETYERETYGRVHRGKKRNYDWRLAAMERALTAGIENVGLGILLGVGSWREDLAGLMAHAYRIKETHGCFPATFSFPRLRPIHGVASFGSEAVSDEDFQKILAASRLACPEVGIVLTTRETPDFRRKLLEAGIGVTHLSAGSSTVPGGYTLEMDTVEDGQFELADHRPLAQVVDDVLKFGYQASFSRRSCRLSR